MGNCMRTWLGLFRTVLVFREKPEQRETCCVPLLAPGNGAGSLRLELFFSSSVNTLKETYTLLIIFVLDYITQFPS